MFESVIPRSLDDFASVGLVFFYRGIRYHADIIVNIKAKQRPRLSPGFVYDEIVECVVLRLVVYH